MSDVKIAQKGNGMAQMTYQRRVATFAEFRKSPDKFTTGTTAPGDAPVKSEKGDKDYKWLIKENQDALAEYKDKTPEELKNALIKAIQDNDGGELAIQEIEAAFKANPEEWKAATLKGAEQTATAEVSEGLILEGNWNLNSIKKGIGKFLKGSSVMGIVMSASTGLLSGLMASHDPSDPDAPITKLATTILQAIFPSLTKETAQVVAVGAIAGALAFTYLRHVGASMVNNAQTAEIMDRQGEAAKEMGAAKEGEASQPEKK